MGEARMKAMNGATLSDMSVSDRAIREGRKMFCHSLSEKLLIAMADVPTKPEYLVKRAWDLASLQYDEMIRRRAVDDEPVTLTEQMAANNIAAGGM